MLTLYVSERGSFQAYLESAGFGFTDPVILHGRGEDLYVAYMSAPVHADGNIAGVLADWIEEYARGDRAVISRLANNLRAISQDAARLR